MSKTLQTFIKKKIRFRKKLCFCCCQAKVSDVCFFLREEGMRKREREKRPVKRPDKMDCVALYWQPLWSPLYPLRGPVLVLSLTTALRADSPQQLCHLSQSFSKSHIQLLQHMQLSHEFNINLQHFGETKNPFFLTPIQTCWLYLFRYKVHVKKNRKQIWFKHQLSVWLSKRCRRLLTCWLNNLLLCPHRPEHP